MDIKNIEEVQGLLVSSETLRPLPEISQMERSHESMPHSQSITNDYKPITEGGKMSVVKTEVFDGENGTADMVAKNPQEPQDGAHVCDTVLEIKDEFLGLEAGSKDPNASSLTECPNKDGKDINNDDAAKDIDTISAGSSSNKSKKDSTNDFTNTDGNSQNKRPRGRPCKETKEVSPLKRSKGLKKQVKEKVLTTLETVLPSNGGKGKRKRKIPLKFAEATNLLPKRNRQNISSNKVEVSAAAKVAAVVDDAEVSTSRRGRRKSVAEVKPSAKSTCNNRTAERNRKTTRVRSTNERAPRIKKKIPKKEVQSEAPGKKRGRKRKAEKANKEEESSTSQDDKKTNLDTDTKLGHKADGTVVKESQENDDDKTDATGIRPKRRRRAKSQIKKGSFCGKLSGDETDINNEFDIRDNKLDVIGDIYKRDGEKFICKLCGVVLKKRLNAHHARHKNMEALNCEHCDATFFRHELYIAHRSVHANEPKNFTCSLCMKSFAEEKYYNRHQEKCSVDTLLPSFGKCEYCDQTFTTSIEYRRHIQRHKEYLTEERKFKCPVCGFCSKTKANLNKHMFVHSDKKPEICEICGIGFKRKSNLTSHKNVVHGERSHQFICDVCGKTFRVMRCLDNHMLIHTGEKPFKCPHCNKAFRNSENMRKHAKRHEKKYIGKCDICNKGFVQKNHLENHMLIHSGFKPFHCQTCGKQFTQKINLQVHEKTHSAIRPYVCPHCKKDFISPSNLRVHLNKHHADKIVLDENGKIIIPPATKVLHLDVDAGGNTNKSGNTKEKSKEKPKQVRKKKTKAENIQVVTMETEVKNETETDNLIVVEECSQQLAECNDPKTCNDNNASVVTCTIYRMDDQETNSGFETDTKPEASIKNENNLEDGIQVDVIEVETPSGENQGTVKKIILVHSLADALSPNNDFCGGPEND